MKNDFLAKLKSRLIQYIKTFENFHFLIIIKINPQNFSWLFFEIFKFREW